MDSGEKFWTGAKRFPRAADLEMSEEQHTAFVLATANLLAAGCGLSPQEKGLLPLEHPQRDVEGIKGSGGDGVFARVCCGTFWVFLAFLGRLCASLCRLKVG